MKAAKNLVYKCIAFCVRLFGNQQGGITKKGMGDSYNELRYVTQRDSFSVGAMFKKKKRGTSEAIAEPINTRIKDSDPISYQSQLSRAEKIHQLSQRLFLPLTRCSTNYSNLRRGDYL